MLRIWLVSLTVIVLLGCTDGADTIEPITPNSPSLTWTSGKPAGAPSEFDEPTHIERARLEVWIGSGYAGTDSYLSYWGSNAKVTATARLLTGITMRSPPTRIWPK